MNSTVVVRANDQAEPSLVVFGRDDAGKPRASWFDAGSADLASKAADLMKMRALRLETEEGRPCSAARTGARVFERSGVYAVCAHCRVQPTRRARRGQQRPFHEGKHQRQTRCGREQRIGGFR